jgi:hypothetical protein
MTTPIVSGLKNYYIELSRNFWAQVAVSILKPPHTFREFITVSGYTVTVMNLKPFRVSRIAYTVAVS